MATFPDVISSIPALEPMDEGLVFRTLSSQFDDLGEEKRKKKWLYPKRFFLLKYKGISTSDAQTLWEFFISRGGSYEAFSFFYPFSRVYDGEYVGTGNDSDTIWSLPAKTSSGYTLYLDGATLTAGGTDWTFGSASGADGEDQATLVAAPGEGERLTYDFTGYLKVRCKIAEDSLSFQTFYNLIAHSGLKLQGLLNSTWTAS